MNQVADLINAIAANADALPPELAERVRQILDGRRSALELLAVHLEPLPAGAGDFAVRLEAGKLLRELAMAAGAGDRDIDIHAGAPS